MWGDTNVGRIVQDPYSNEYRRRSNLVLVLDPVLKSIGTVTSLALAWPGMGTATATTATVYATV